MILFPKKPYIFFYLILILEHRFLYKSLDFLPNDNIYTFYNRTFHQYTLKSSEFIPITNLILIKTRNPSLLY